MNFTKVVAAIIGPTIITIVRLYSKLLPLICLENGSAGSGIRQ
ncbi:hypothetical protein J2Y03_004083 [Neobacillus niacini]|nr:hypothetical protein [Neobacillus niacini]